MDRSSEELISKTQMNFTDLSNLDQSQEQAMGSSDDNSMQPEAAAHKGLCLKEFDDQLTSLKKENFNLKFRIYLLEQKNPNAPEGADALHKQIVDLKVENNILKNDNEIMIDELNHKIEALNSEIASLQVVNRSGQSNGTGYADCAVNSKDIEYQQKLLELNQIERIFNKKMSEMNEMMRKLQGDKLATEAKVSQLLYENDEMKNKLANVELACQRLFCSFQPLRENPCAMREKTTELKNEEALAISEALATEPSESTRKISEERNLLLTANSDNAEACQVSSSTDPACNMCPKYQAKVAELKKYLARAMDKIKSQSDMKTLNDQQIQKRVSSTESFIQQARSDMATILKNRNK